MEDQPEGARISSWLESMKPQPPTERYICVYGRPGEAERLNREAWATYQAELALWQHEHPEDAELL